MAKYVAESKFIASIYPGKLPEIIKYVGPDPAVRDRNGKANSRATVYRLKPVPRGGKPFMLEVTDSFENVPNPMKTAESSKGDRKGANMIFDSNLVSCEEIAQGLVQEWVGNMVKMPVGGAPGIMIVVGTVPTQAELEHMQQAQTIYFESLYSEAQRLADIHLVDKITQPMRDAAEWLGREPKWVPKSTDLIACPVCRKDIAADSIKCAVCGTQLQALPPELAKLNQRQTTAA